MPASSGAIGSGRAVGFSAFVVWCGNRVAVEAGDLVGKDGGLPARAQPPVGIVDVGSGCRAVDRFARGLAVDGRLPQWTAWRDEDDVARLFPDAHTRSVVSAEQPRLPLAYYEQRIPVPEGWDSRPCGYLLFGPPYDRWARESRDRGWPVEHLPGGHLHQMVDPDAVTDRIVAMTAGWLRSSD